MREPAPIGATIEYVPDSEIMRKKRVHVVAQRGRVVRYSQNRAKGQTMICVSGGGAIGPGIEFTVPIDDESWWEV